MLEIKLLLLLLVANGAPVMAWDLWRERYALPVDGGLILADGRPLFGGAKTWRGLFASLTISSLCAPLLGLAWTTGFVIAMAAMGGDLLSSFVKRRFGISPSGKAQGLDQIPESLLPLVAVREYFNLTGGEIALLVAVFFLLEISLSPVLFRLGIRKRPY